MLKADIDKIITDCSEYISLLKECPKGYFLYRGFRGAIVDFWLFTHDFNRKPLHTPQEIHDRINTIYEAQFGWKIRSGVFCFGSKSLARVPPSLTYGKQYLLFPVGAFNFVFSPEHFDLFISLSDKTITEDTLPNIAFRNGSLKDAIESGDHGAGLSHEICVNVLNYYLIDVTHKSTLADIIWQ